MKSRLKQRMFDAQGGKCWICGNPMRADVDFRHPEAVTFDHIKPISLGGKWEDSNLKLAHKLCNNRRGNGTEPKPFTAAWLRAKGYMGM